MRIEVRIEISAQREGKKAQNDPDKPVLPKRQEEKWQRQVEWRQKKEVIKPHTLRKTRQIVFHRLGSVPMNGDLHSVVQLLFDGEFPMRDGIRLKGECSGHAILIPAEHVRKCGPTPSNLFVLDESQRDCRNDGEHDQGHSAR